MTDDVPALRRSYRNLMNPMTQDAMHRISGSRPDSHRTAAVVCGLIGGQCVLAMRFATYSAGTLLSSRVEARMHSTQVRAGDMRVYLGRADIRMP